MGQKRRKKAAVVHCSGGCRAESGIPREMLTGDCRQALEDYPGGVLLCEWGCIGMGSCVNACRLDAVHINGSGAAQTDWEKCIGCGLCVKACPQNLIELVEPEFNIYTACVNENPGKKTAEECRSGCIACGICVKNCPVGAVSIKDSHAVIDREKCIACGMCAVKCPRGVIRDCYGIFTDSEMQEEV